MTNASRHPGYHLYICIVGVTGLSILMISVSALTGGGVSPNWMFLALLTSLTSAFPVKIPETGFKISIEDTFFFTNLILFGPDAGVFTAALQGFMGSIRTKSNRRRLEFMIFNTGALLLTGYISGQVFFRLHRAGPVYGAFPVTLGEIVFPLGMTALTHYVTNSITVAIVLALDLRRNIYEVWKKNLSWTSATYLAGAWIAGLIAVNISHIRLAALVATAPVVYITYFIYRMYREKIESQLQQIRELNDLYLRTVESLALAVDAKDQTTHGHIRRVRAYAVGLARLLAINDKNELLAIETGALLHDIGKLAIDDYILNKPGRLNKQEFDKMKIHAAAGEEILDQIQFPFPVAKLVRSHHERWDGSGYPDGLKGEVIPLGARILTIADSYDAIRSARPYKVSRGTAEAAAELQRSSGTMFDPTLLALFLANIDELERKALEAANAMPELQYRRHLPGDASMPPPGSGESAHSGMDAPAELLSLFEFCTSLGANLCLSDILLNLESRLRRMIPFESCAVFLAGDDASVRPAHAGGSLAGTLLKLSIPFGKGISGWVTAYGRPMMNTGAALEFGRLQSEYGFLSDTLVVPLMEGACCIGTISLYAETPVRYQEADLQLMCRVASMVSPLIVNARRADSASAAASVVDPITGVHKIRSLIMAGEKLMESNAADGGHLHLLLVRIANMSAISDLYGPSTRDRLLAQAAQKLIAETRGTDVAARFGQESFVLLLPGAKRDQIPGRCRRFQELISSIHTQDGTFLSVQIGAACHPDDGSTILDLLEIVQRSPFRIESEATAPRAVHGSKVVGFGVSQRG